MLRRSIAMTTILGLLLFGMPQGERSDHLAAEEESAQEDSTRPALDAARTLRVETEGAVVEMTLADYLEGVVAAEMPATFAPEALKAQTTAARTYTLYQMAHGSSGKHESGADLCDDPGCCQAYRSQERLRESWGEAAEEHFAAIHAAEQATDGMAILYEGEPILAAFHSSSAEGTEDAAAAWSASVPYLQRVESPAGEEDAPNYRTSVRFTEQEFRDCFFAAYPAGTLSGSSAEWVRVLSRDESGYVTTVQVGDQTLRGVELRRMLSLRSACFRVTVEDGALCFATQGYGHGVGMSQYGANALAGEGKSWEEILQWYYTGVTIAPYGA